MTRLNRATRDPSEPPALKRMIKTKMPIAAVWLVMIVAAAQPSAAADQPAMAAKLDLNKPVVNAGHHGHRHDQAHGRTEHDGDRARGEG